MSHKSIQEDLAELTGRIMFGESADKKMTVGSTPMGDLPGPAKETQKGTGSENTEAKKEVEAPESLQGDTVEDSKKGGAKGKSKFEELYSTVVSDKQVVSEEAGEAIESPSFNDEINDFPPAGADEEGAERDEALGETKSLADLFRDLADTMSSIGDRYAEEDGELGDEEMITDEGQIGEGEALAGEAVESTPAPDSTAKLQSKGNMKVNGVKVVKKAVSSDSSGQVDGGKPKNQPDSTLGPKTSLKANGSGAAADGKNASLFENKKK